MNDLPIITDVDNQSFATLVTERSHTLPVLVDYWADWCGPCQMQMPVLKKLVEEYAGALALAKVNTDEQRELSRAHNIRSLPTLRLYKNGELVEEISGAQTESTLRVMLDRHIDRASDQAREQARELFAAGQHEQALALLQAARESEPDNHLLTLDYAALRFKTGNTDSAAQLLDTLPRDIREEPAGAGLRALLDFAAQLPAGQTVPALEQAVNANPGDSDSRHRPGCAYVLQDDYAMTRDAFMYLLQHDRGYGDDAARKSLLALFNLLGESDERVGAWRRSLFNALH